MASVFENFDRQPPAVKVVAVAGVGLLGYVAYRAIKRKADEDAAAKAAQAAHAELQQLANQGVVPSYGESQFQVFVNRLVQAMTGCGTNEDQVFDVFRAMNNEADIRKLITTFAVRYYQPCELTSPIQFIYWQFNDKAFGGDLATWLSYDFSSSDIKTINSILRGKGINYQF
jgi:hypothetical protein